MSQRSILSQISDMSSFKTHSPLAPTPFSWVHALQLVQGGLRAEFVLANVQEPASLYELVVSRDPDLIAAASLEAGEHLMAPARALLDAAGFDHLPSQQIVLTGGASQIPGLDMLAARILGQNVRLGRPLRVQGLPQAATGPAFASAVGLALFAAHPQDEWWDFEVPAERYPARSLKRAMRWFKDNW